MKRLSLVLGLLSVLLLLGGAPAWAKWENPCPEGTVLKKSGSIGVKDGTAANDVISISTAGLDVYAVGWQSVAGQAGSGALYDNDVPTTTGDIQFEFGSAASGGNYQELGPMRFKNGISFGGVNVAGVIVYACVAP